MTISTLGSIRSQYVTTLFSTEVVSGGSVTASTTFNLRFCGRSRAGLNLLSDAVPVTIPSGSKLKITISSDVRKSGEDLFSVLIGAETTGIAADTKPLCEYECVESDQITLKSLPATIELSTNTHLVRGGTVANVAALPSTSQSLLGMVRYCNDVAKYYRFNGTAWQPYTPLIYPVDTTDVGGCDRDASALGDNPVIVPDYAADGSVSTPIKLWLQNGLTEDTGSPLPQGTALDFVVALDGQTSDAEGKSYSGLFADKVLLNLLGIVRRSTGEIDVSYAEQSIGWGANSPLFLPTELKRGYAIAFSFAFRFRAAQLEGKIPRGAKISVLLHDRGLLGSPSAIWSFVGDSVSNFGGKLRIVPGRSSIKRLSGSATIKGFDTPYVGESTFAGLAADASGQLCAISGAMAADIIVRQAGATLLNSEAVRAVVSTASGTSSASPLSSSITVSANTTLSVTVSHPCDANGFGQIRADYPDAIAGNLLGVFNPLQMKVFISFGGAIFQVGILGVIPSPTQTIEIETLAGATQVGTLPVATSTFGLFSPVGVSAIQSTVLGSLAAGTYQVAIAYYYPPGNTEITAISHSSPDCIPEFAGSLTDLSKIKNSWGDTVYLLSGSIDAAIRATTPSVDGQVRAIDSRASIRSDTPLVYYDAYSTEAERATASSRVWIPTGRESTTGRWKTFNAVVGPIGATGVAGPTGLTGVAGTAATIAVGTVTAVAAGAAATVTNVGTSATAIFNFNIPRGTGATVSAGTATALAAGASPTVNNSGSNVAATFNFGIPAGATGATGLTGLTGLTGATPTITVGTVSSLTSGATATVTNTGTTGAAIFNFGIPRGVGASITIGTVTALAAGASPTIANTGTASAAIFDFGIPAGATGAAGPTGPTGPVGSVGTEGTITFSTGSLSPGIPTLLSVVIAQVAIFTGITTSVAARVRAYNTAGNASTDLLRSQSTSPAKASGLVFDVTTGSGINSDGSTVSNQLSWSFSGSPHLVNGETPKTSNAAIVVTNNSGSSANISVTLTYYTLRS